MAGQAVVEGAVAAWAEANGLALRIGGPDGGGLQFQLAGARTDPAPRSDRGWLDTASELRATLRRSTWCRPATEWATATPIALDRFPGDLSSARVDMRETAEAAARATIARACLFAGLPEPTDVEVDTVSFLSAVPPANRKGRGRGFPAFVAGTSRQARLGVHARLRFAEPVAGPVLVGAGRYLGYGLCLPLDLNKRRR
jgi:CRISPR-associated protein Csb2